MTGKKTDSEMVSKRGPRRKIPRVIDEYDLDDLGDRLEASWLGTGDDQYSLRDLADVFNQAVLRAAMEEAGMITLDGEVENYYRLLTSEEVSSGMRVQAENRLGEHDIDVDQLTGDFVSHQAIYNYLTEHRQVDYAGKTPAEDRVMKAREVLQRLQNRTEAVTTRTLTQLQNDPDFTLGNFEVLVTVTVLCTDCGHSAPLTELLTTHACNCHPTPDPAAESSDSNPSTE